MRTPFRFQRALSGASVFFLVALAACRSSHPAPGAGLEFALVADKPPAALELDRVRANGSKEHFLLEQPEHFAVEHASMTQDPSTGHPAILYELKPEDAQRFQAWTTAHVDQQMAVLVNRRVYTVARIAAPLGGKGVITGGSDGLTPHEAQRLLEELGAAE
jgi:preprotein translocase subunit SecD